MPAPTIESHNHSISSGGTTTTIAVSAAGAGRVIVVSTTIGCIGAVAPVLSISGGGANVGAWTSIGNLGPSGAACLIQSWYAVTTGVVGAVTVTITSSLTIDDAATSYITVAGANTTQPLDQNTTLARGASNGSSAFSRAVGAPIAWTVSTNTANVLIFGQVGANANQTYGSPLANSTLTETVNNSGGTFFANIAVFTAPFTTQQTNTTIGSSASNTATVTGIAFGVTADGGGGAAAAQARVMVIA